MSNRHCQRCWDCHVKYNRGKNNSNYKNGKLKCIDCGKIRNTYFNQRCWSCYVKHNVGKNHHGYKNGKPKCIDCGKELSNYNNKRCNFCRGKYFSGKNSSHWKNAKRKWICIDCGKKLMNSKTTKRCSKCHWKFSKGCNHPAFKNAPRHFTCIDCGRKLTERSRPAERCRKCYYKQLGRGKNKGESFLEKILKSIIPKEYKYVGDGKFFIERYNPDFVNVNSQKKVIELFGDYWHKIPNRIEKDKIKIRTYKKYGYDCLVIWEHDLKKPKTINRILEFNQRENKHEYRTAK